MIKTKKENFCFFTKKTPTHENTKSSLLEAARKIFSEKGFEGSSVRDICELVGANVSAIKYHFGGKEGLYRECIQEFGDHRLKATEIILTECQSPEEFKLRLKMYAEDFINTNINQLHATKMICRELETENPLIEDIFQNTFLKIFEKLDQFISYGQKRKWIHQGYDSHILASIFIHTITTSIRNDHLGEKYFSRSLKNAEYKENFIKNLINIMTGFQETPEKETTHA
jgi:AcrR family transcriptional regulator